MCCETDGVERSSDVILQINEQSQASPSSKPYLSSKEQPNARSIPLVELSLENITYAPSTRSSSKSKARRQILSDVSTTISPHTLNAWMGPSGSGETKLQVLCVMHVCT